MSPDRLPLGPLGALSAVGIGFVLAVAIGFLAGFALDRWLGTTPLFTVVLFFAGVAAGILNIVRTARAVSREEKKR
jgi:ATP synthase protein I